MIKFSKNRQHCAGDVILRCAQDMNFAKPLCSEDCLRRKFEHLKPLEGLTHSPAAYNNCMILQNDAIVSLSEYSRYLLAKHLAPRKCIIGESPRTAQFADFATDPRVWDLPYNAESL